MGVEDTTQTREHLCRLARSLFDRGLTFGASGNISIGLEDGSVLVTPTGKSLGFLEPDQLSRIAADGRHLSGLPPTKEVPLHTAFYETRRLTGAVVHLHSTHSVAFSMQEGLDEDDVLPPITPYSIMRLGRVKLLPIFLPGDPAMGTAIRGLAGQHSAVLLANHGPVVAGRDLESTVWAIEELEETAKLSLLMRGTRINTLEPHHLEALRKYEP